MPLTVRPESQNSICKQNGPEKRSLSCQNQIEKQVKLDYTNNFNFSFNSREKTSCFSFPFWAECQNLNAKIFHSFRRNLSQLIWSFAPVFGTKELKSAGRPNDTKTKYFTNTYGVTRWIHSFTPD